jgi:TetR/AcrR family transcriptional repressor of nem operon
MKVTREQVAKNRERILEAAGKLFREKGFDGVGVADIMKSAGLTHGGFYGHFASKDDLAAQACAAALAHSIKSETMPAGDNAQDQLEAFVAAYLSPRHRDDRGGGCVLPALSGEAARQRGALRHTFTEGIRSIVAMLAKIAPGGSNAARREKALATLAGLVGALTLARAADDPSLSDEILNAALVTFSGKSRAADKRMKVARRESATKRVKAAKRDTRSARS